jgi:hypothetical protein
MADGMKSENSLRFDVTTLGALAGGEILSRGDAYHGGGDVEIIAIKLLA